MTRGPDQQRLKDYVDPARMQTLNDAAKDWDRGSTILRNVSIELRRKAQAIRTSPDAEFTGETAKVAAEAFDVTAKTMDDKSTEMKDGAGAFGHAATAVKNAQDTSDDLETKGPGAFPPSVNTPPGSSHHEDVVAQQQHDTAVNDWWAKYNHNERVARHAITTMQDNHTEQAKVFQRIHGETPPDNGPVRSEWQQPGEQRGRPADHPRAELEPGRPPHHDRLGRRQQQRHGQRH